jgi:hypothetical protein
MCIHRNTLWWTLENIAKHNVGCLASDTRETLVGFLRRRHLAVMLSDKRRAAFLNTPSFLSIEASGLDGMSKFIRSGLHIVSSCAVCVEQGRSDAVDALIGALCRENSSDE